MENKQTKLKRFFGLMHAAFIILFLSAYTSNSQKAAVTADDTQNNSDDNQALSTSVYNQELSVIGHKCVGCGKCARLDPEHFSIDGSNRKAIVISNENLQSSNLSAAISICPGQAIELS